jgi:hypothetical protein
MKYFCLLFFIPLFSCNPKVDRLDSHQIRAMVPIYSTQQSANVIGVEAAKPTLHPGKIYAYGNYIFQIEESLGIHIIDNTIPQQAHKIAFLRVLSASEISIKSNFLYTNNLNDMVVFDISNISSPQLVNRIQNAFPQISQDYPPFEHVSFECVDHSRGTVIGWEEKIVDEEPKCRR